MMVSLRALLLASCIALALAPGSSAAADCTYSVDPGKIDVTWTAFKFIDKTAVTGRFNTRKVTGPTSASSPIALASGLAMEIDGTSVETDNPARNATISEFFFAKLKPAGTITASVEKVNGDEQKGTIDMKITMNGVSRVVPFSYTATPEGAVAAHGSFDMLDFALQGPFDSLHEACGEMHTGKDGVSKTWTDVEVLVKGTFTKSCS